MSNIINDLEGENLISRARWGQERRLEFIDFRLFWDGRVNRADLTAHFGISIPQASMDLASYQEIAPNNLVYDRQEKAYLATDSFAPIITSPSAHLFLNQIRQVEAGMLTPESTFLGWYPPSGVVRHPTRRVNPTLLRSILQTIRRKESLSIRYQSMHSVDPSDREISPHAIAFDGIRWHIRAFSFQHNDFHDFVFARILSFDKSPLPGVDPLQDLAWSTMIEVVVKPNPELSIGQQRAIELDYDMKGGCLRIEVREALLVYMLTQLAVTPHTQSMSRPNQVVLVNKDDLIPVLRRLGIDWFTE